VLVVDDQRVVRDGLTALLEVLDGLEVVGAASDGAQALEAGEQHHRTSCSWTCACR
jgi:YesN/AraC family two-component response regulator